MQKDDKSKPAAEGVYPILFAYYDQEERLHESNMRRQIVQCLEWGVDGIAALGLATEVGKLTNHEKRKIIEWVCEEVGGRKPVAITLSEQSVSAQIELAQYAVGCGADWLILQPAATKNVPEIEHIRFLGRIADAIDRPFAVQNAPEYLGTSLSNGALKELNRQHQNICILKAEGSTTYINGLIEQTDGAYSVFNGRGGLEFTDNIRAGCVGMIPAPETCDVQTKMLRLMKEGTQESNAEAERLYREMLPLITFLIQSIETFLCYGKRLFAERAGLEVVFDRTPSVQPRAWGTESVSRYSKFLDNLGQP